MDVRSLQEERFLAAKVLPFGEGDQQTLVPPFLLHFLEAASPIIDAEPTAGAETPYQTGLDNRFKDDTMEDEDEESDRPDQTGLLADSNDREDEDY